MEDNSFEKDNIHPDHYKNSTSLECIEAMEIIFGTDAVMGFCLCNAWKYIWRWKHKNGKEDLNKALWYCSYGNSICEDKSKQSLFKRMARYIESEL